MQAVRIYLRSSAFIGGYKTFLSGVDKRIMKLVLLSCAAVCALPTSSFAQPLPKDYPNKPIRVVVPSPPGGPPDLIMRMIAPKMSAGLGQNLVIDNRAGAGGVVGTNFVAKAAPDGYTWLFTTASHT